MRDRRRANRYKSNLFVRIVPVASKGKTVRGVVVDMSQTGFAIETEGELALTEDFDFHIEIPFALRARVVRRTPQGQIKRYGLAIIGQNFVDKWILKRLLKGVKETKRV